MGKLNPRHTGLAVVIAWPSTYCKQSNSWYDPLCAWLGFSKNNYYLAGHAALVLIDKSDQVFHYFDFGRYHAPYNHGRVRNSETDHELAINIKADLSEDHKTLLNLNDLLKVLQNSTAYHGSGTIYASTAEINFRDAYNNAMEIQKMGAVPYGPFKKGSSNCSRFVFSSLYAGKPALKYLLKLKFLVPLTPTPMSNVRAFINRASLPPVANPVSFFPQTRPDNLYLSSTLAPPALHPDIPSGAQWLAGEGAGSWFSIEPSDSFFRITRYSPEGIIECQGDYYSSKLTNKDLNQNAEICHHSNCQTVTISINGKKEVLKRSV